MNSKLLKIRLL